MGQYGIETEYQGGRDVPERGISSPGGWIRSDGHQRGAGRRQEDI